MRRRVADRLRDGRFGELFDGLVRNIFVPTIVGGGFRANVLPGHGRGDGEHAHAARARSRAR